MVVASQVAESRHLEGFLAFWRARQIRRKEQILYLACLVTVCGIAAVFSMRESHAYTHDIFFFLDGAWRVLHGQRPHLDFYSPHGAFSYFIPALGLKISHYAVQGLAYGKAIFGLTIGLWTYALMRHRMHERVAILAGLSLCLLAIGPYPLGERYTDLSMAMSYNRWGYALLGLILLEVFQEAPEEGARRQAIIGGISSGCACALLLFLKLSYGLVALEFLTFSFFFWQQRRLRLAAYVAGLVAVSMVFCVYLRFSLGAMLADTQMGAHAKGQGLALGLLADRTYTSLGDLCKIAAFAFLGLLSELLPGEQVWRQRLRFCVLVGLVLAAGLFLLFTNYQQSGLPLNGILALVFVDRLLKLRAGRWDDWTPYRNLLAVALVVWGLFLAVPVACQDLTGVVYAAARNFRHSKYVAQRVNTPLMAGFTVYEGDFGQQEINRVNDGITLLRQSSRSGETVQALDFMNPFSYALERPPVKGGTTCLDPGGTFSDSYKPPAKRLFGNADILMVSRGQSSEEVECIRRNYSRDIEAGYRLVKQSAVWSLYRRR